MIKLTEKRLTVEEMQNWDKPFKISKEDVTRVIDTFEEGEFWTVHGNEAYNLCIRLNNLHEENQELKELIKLIAHADSYPAEESVKETIRHKIRGLDSVSGESAGAWKDYVLLSKFFKEYYKEEWDNYDE